MDGFSLIAILRFMKRCCTDSQKAEKCTRSLCWSVSVRRRFKAHFNLYFELEQMTFISLHLDEWPCWISLPLNQEMFLASASSVPWEVEHMQANMSCMTPAQFVLVMRPGEWTNEWNCYRFTGCVWFAPINSKRPSDKLRGWDVHQNIKRRLFVVLHSQPNHTPDPIRTPRGEKASRVSEWVGVRGDMH